MNTLAACFGYTSVPWLNFDQGSAVVNFYSAESVRRFFSEFSDVRLANTIKSHHPFVFFRGNADYLFENYRVIYIHRHPLGALMSFWKLINSLSWTEGPRLPTFDAFLKAPPAGNCMRFQMTQQPSMLHRWNDHVQGWTSASGAGSRFMVLRYEDLDEEFENSVHQLGDWLKLPIHSLQRPDRRRGVIHPSEFSAHESQHEFSPETLNFLSSVSGDLLDKLGYD